MSSHSPAHRWLISVAAVSTLALASACGVGEQGDGASASSPEKPAGGAETESPSAGDDEGTASAEGAFNAGEYVAEGSYNSPAGEQSVQVDVTLEADGTITAIEVVPQAESGNSLQFQSQFAGAVTSEVIGQRIDELSVSKVAGSSATSGGFNAAIAEIMAQAQA